MDTFELNKIAGAVLGAALLMMVISEIGNFLVHPEQLDKAVIEIAAQEAAPAQDAGEEGPPLSELLAAADVGKGEKQAKKCAACHSFDKGGANKIGPNLYAILGRDVASVDGFSYSEALTGIEGDWGWENLSAFLANPKAFAAGTKMAFAGVKRDNQRADLLLYLHSLADSPFPMPE